MVQHSTIPHFCAPNSFTSLCFFQHCSSVWPSRIQYQHSLLVCTTEKTLTLQYLSMWPNPLQRHWVAGPFGLDHENESLSFLVLLSRRLQTDHVRLHNYLSANSTISSALLGFLSFKNTNRSFAHELYSCSMRIKSMRSSALILSFPAS